MPRLLLLVPTATYRAGAFLHSAKKLDVDVTIASEEPSTLSEFLPTDLITLDFADVSACVDTIKAFAAEHSIDAVIGVDDQVTLVAASIAAVLSLPHNPVEAAHATRNKHEMRKRLHKAGVSQPGFRLFSLDRSTSDIDSSIAFPCVVKPLAFSASRGVIRANNQDEFADAVERIRNILSLPDAPKDDETRGYVLVEDYVPGWEVAVEGILDDSRLNDLAIFDKPDPLEGPYFPETIYVTPSRLPAQVQKRVVMMTQEATRALGLRHGPIHAELRGHDDDVWFIEVAARSIGGYCSKVLQFEGGMTLEDVIIQHTLGTIDGIPAREQAAAGVMMMQAPRTGRYKTTRGLEEARLVDGVTEDIISSHPGQVLSPLPEGFLYLGFIFARERSPHAVEEALRAAHKKLDFVIDPV